MSDELVSGHEEVENVPTETPGEAQPAPAEIAAPAISEIDEFEQAMQALDTKARNANAFKHLVEGDVITGTVMRVDKEGVLVDVGAKSEGIIMPEEFSRDANFVVEDAIKIGDKIRVYVIKPENQDGNPILSKKRADFEHAWVRVELARDNNETITANVQQRVKGGLTVDLGIRGFVPASHVGNGSIKNNLDKYVGQSLPFKVIEVDKERRKVILSHKLAIQEEREHKSAETKASLTPGQVRKGTVRRLLEYGAFIDLGGVDGLLHISEMSWTRINSPKEVLRECQEIDVMVLKVDLENNRVSLGLRQILPDPWAEIPNRYAEGDVITGKVTRVVSTGAFVLVEGGIEGFIPQSEFTRKVGSRGSVPPAENEDAEVKIIAIKPTERKLTLSLRALQVPEEPAPAPAPEAATTPPAPPREGGGRKREKERDRDSREEYTRYQQDDEPRFTIGEAFAAAKRVKSERRERRRQEEEGETLVEEELLVPEEEVLVTEE